MSEPAPRAPVPPLITQEFVTRFVAVLATAGLCLSFLLLAVAMSMYPGFSLVSHTLSRLGRQSLACGAEGYLGQPAFNAAYVFGAAALIPLYAVFARGSHVSGQK
ncbi:MAG: hypothetical protein JW839_16435, partial [Candidatus Lokiarchaeota archaeon]|nr:hypothetical protein [Candidatus Lokiarchaeota archaeon]